MLFLPLCIANKAKILIQIALHITLLTTLHIITPTKIMKFSEYIEDILNCWNTSNFCGKFEYFSPLAKMLLMQKQYKHLKYAN